MTTSNKRLRNLIGALPPHLRGPSQNRYGGQRTQRMRGFRNNTYGAAGPCRVFSREEQQAWLDARGEKR